MRKPYDVDAACDTFRNGMLKPSTRIGIWAAVVIIAFVLAAVVSQQQPPRSASADQPEITYMFPEEGDVFSEPLLVIQICFKEPIDVRDLPPKDDGEFTFSLERPNGFNVGMRIVFQANGYGVAIYPGDPEDARIGEWVLSYHVRDRESLDPIDGTLTYEVREGGQPIITPTPQMCPSDGGTFAPTAEPSPDPNATPTPVVNVEEDGDSDALLLSLLAIGAAGGAGVLLLLGYAFRRRIGWWLHDPKDEPDSGDHH